MSHRIVRIVITTLGAVSFFAAAAFAATPAARRDAASTRAKRLSRQAIAENGSWRGYDEAPATALVHPVRVLRVTGDVSNPQALADPASGQTTTLTYPLGATAPSLILDYGQDVGGLPELADAAGTGLIQTSYSETLRNMGEDGATSVTLFQSGNGTRSDLFDVIGAGTVKASTISGGERYEKVTLTTPGSVTLRSPASTSRRCAKPRR